MVCSRCTMDTSDPAIGFDSKGVCNHCHEWDEAMKTRTVSGIAGLRYLEETADKIRAAGKDKKFDCVLGMSGGYDSSYVAYLVSRLGLRPYCMSVANGYDTETSISNVRNLCKQLHFFHETIELNRNEFRDLQLAYLKAGVINLEVPSDHAINALVYRETARLGLKYIMSGLNVVTEWTLPQAWIYDHMDVVNLKNIHKKFGTVPLKTFPTMGHQRFAYYSVVKGIVSVRVLNYINYDKRIAKQTLEREFGWADYGAKHHESHITRFFQCHILPKYWGIDKRKAHLSCLVRAGQMTRAEALAELSHPPCSEMTLYEDKMKVCQYLGLKEKELDNLLAQPHHRHEEYGSEPRSSLMTKGYWLFTKIKGIK